MSVTFARIPLRPETCETCKYWQRWGKQKDNRSEGSPDFGDCRRHAPLLITNRAEGQPERTKFPSIAANSFCGDYKQTEGQPQ